MRAIHYFPHFILKSPFAKRFLTPKQNKPVSRYLFLKRLKVKGEN